MEKSRKYHLLFAFILLIALAACTKSETRSKRLFKQGRWKVSQLDIGNNHVTMLPKWNITEEPEEKQFAIATWTHQDGSECQFKWRFDYYEGTFSFEVDNSITQDDNLKAFVQCDNLSGSYFILTDKRRLFEFSSTTTKGYVGIEVFLQLTPM